MKASATAPRRFSWKTRFAAIALSLACGLVVAEFTLRALGINFAAPYVFDRYCGHRLAPNLRYWQFTEGSATVTTNSQGMRDREHSREKPPNTLRIAVLGDSFAEALQVQRDQAFWAVMERELANCDALRGRHVEVLNFGVSGYGTTQELQMLRHYVWDYQPDIVLLAFLPGNDVRNNSRILEPENTERPFHELVNGELRLDDNLSDPCAHSWSLRLKTALVRHVRLLGLAYRCKENLRAWWSRPAETALAAELGLDDPVFAPPHEPKWREAWSITAAVLGEMQRETNSHGAQFVVAVLNNGMQVQTDSPGAVNLRKRLGVADLDYPDRRLTEIGAEYGFPVLLLTPRMRELARSEGTVFHGFPNTTPGEGHWNALGHRTAGELLARDLCALME